MALLQTDRLALRRTAAGDLNNMAELLGDPEVMRYYRSAKSRDQAQAWIDRNVENYQRYGFGLWIVETRDGEFVGDCGLTMQAVEGAEEVEIGYHVRAELQRQGFATEAATACRDYAATRGVVRLIAIIRPDNLASQRVAEKVGLAFEKSVVRHRGERHIYSAHLCTPSR